MIESITPFLLRREQRDARIHAYHLMLDLKQNLKREAVRSIVLRLKAKQSSLGRPKSLTYIYIYIHIIK